MNLKLSLITALSAFAFSLNACHKTSDTTLSYQYETGSLQWQVVRQEIDPNTLIHKAILENTPEVITFLLAHQVNIDYPDENGMTPLTIAILNKSIDAVKVLLANGANPNPEVRWNNMTLLELTLAMNDPAAANLLVQNGADLTFKDKQGKGILSKVITQTSNQSLRTEWVGVAKKMIELGADIQSSDMNNAPLFDTISAVHCYRVDISLLELLVSGGVNLNMTLNDTSNDTPLTFAISFSDLKLVKYLVESGADINKSKKYSGEAHTPLRLAVVQNRPEIVHYLLQHGARG